MNKLKPCPFCGSEARWATTHAESDWEIQCSNSDCLLLVYGQGQTGEETVAAWNKRVPDPDVLQKVAFQAQQMAEEMARKIKRSQMSEIPSTRCRRCGHLSDWHRLDDSKNEGPTDLNAKFRCIGYDCEAPGPPVKNGCDCPNFVK
jgi:hypothetical protein